MPTVITQLSRTNGYDITPYSGGVLNGTSAWGVSADPYAGTNAPNGLEIWTAEEAADNLTRPGVTWYENNYGALDDNTLTYGFWTFEELMDSYYVSAANSEIMFDEAYFGAEYGMFESFTAAQQAAAEANIELWDDLISISIERADSVNEADITFGATYMSPAAGAYAYYPSGDVDDAFWAEAYGFEEAGRASGDVWINWLYNSPTGEDGFLARPEDDSFSNLTPGAYGWWAVTHELGHSLGLAHGGDYNASDDNDGDGEPDPITYDSDAYFYQDSQQYTMMSYFSASETGADWIDWASGGWYVNAQTPMVHDVLAIQDLYGADMTTRAGNTVYGFNSNLDSEIYDFSRNSTPVLTIWDGGGIDTLDLSGYSTNSIININEGAFSSAGHGIYEYRDVLGAPNLTQAQVNAIAAANGWGDGGRPEDNIAIAYGAQIENAVGGSGNDQIIGNALNNVLTGNAGNDVISGGRGADTINGGAGIDTADYSTSSAGVSVNLVAGKFSGGDAQGDRLSGIENVTGSAFNDKLIGDQGANVLRGGAGNDILQGGGGADQLYGGAGSDVFDMKKIDEVNGDSILDLGAGDVIDLSAIDANAGARGDQAFTFVGDAAFSGTAGELRVQANAGGGSTVSGDVNGDGTADFQFTVTHTDPLTVDYFAL